MATMARYRVEDAEFYGSDRAEIYLGLQHCDPPIPPPASEQVLCAVNIATGTGLLDQIGALAQYASDIFQDLHDQVSSTHSRIGDLKGRMNTVGGKLPAIETKFYRSADTYSFLENSNIDWKPSFSEDHTDLAMAMVKSTEPRSIIEQYDRCVEIPAVDMLNQYNAIDPATGQPADCRKKYSNPDFFFEEFIKAEKVKQERLRDERKKRRQDRRKKDSQKKPDEKKQVGKLEVKKYAAHGKEFADMAGPAQPSNDAEAPQLYTVTPEFFEEVKFKTTVTKLPPIRERSAPTVQITTRAKPDPGLSAHDKYQAEQEIQRQQQQAAATVAWQEEQEKYRQELEVQELKQKEYQEQMKKYAQDLALQEEEEKKRLQAEAAQAVAEPTAPQPRPPSQHDDKPASPILPGTPPKVKTEPTKPKPPPPPPPAPPKPPPPPPAPPKPPASGGGGGGDDHMAAIQAGIQLKPMEASNDMARAGTNDLLAQIQAGRKLKSVKDAPAPKPEPQTMQSGLQAALKNIQKHTQYDSDSAGDDSDGDWDD